jgi:nitrate reductase cytochrome c-type subunit
MRLRKIDGLYVLFAVAVVIGVSMLPTPKDRNPMIPANADHQTVKVEKECLQCHVPAGSKLYRSAIRNGPIVSVAMRA